MKTILYFRTLQDRINVNNDLTATGIDYLGNGLALACDSDHAIMLLLKHPELIHRSDNDQEFIDRWIKLVKSCDRKILRGTNE